MYLLEGVKKDDLFAVECTGWGASDAPSEFDRSAVLVRREEDSGSSGRQVDLSMGFKGFDLGIGLVGPCAGVLVGDAQCDRLDEVNGC